MKSYNNLYEVATSEEIRKLAIHRVCQGRKKVRKVRQYAKDEEKAAELLKSWIENFQSKEHVSMTIYDGVSRKKREIIVPTFEELAVQHCVVLACMPMFMHGMYEHSYASIPERGVHKAKKFIEKWITKDYENCKYVLKMDIRHFFENVSHDILKYRAKKSQTL